MPDAAFHPVPYASVWEPVTALQHFRRLVQNQPVPSASASATIAASIPTASGVRRPPTVTTRPEADPTWGASQVQDTPAQVSTVQAPPPPTAPPRRTATQGVQEEAGRHFHHHFHFHCEIEEQIEAAPGQHGRLERHYHHHHHYHHHYHHNSDDRHLEHPSEGLVGAATEPAAAQHRERDQEGTKVNVTQSNPDRIGDVSHTPQDLRPDHTSDYGRLAVTADVDYNRATLPPRQEMFEAIPRSVLSPIHGPNANGGPPGDPTQSSSMTSMQSTAPEATEQVQVPPPQPLTQPTRTSTTLQQSVARHASGEEEYRPRAQQHNAQAPFDANKRGSSLPATSDRQHIDGADWSFIDAASFQSVPRKRPPAPPQLARNHRWSRRPYDYIGRWTVEEEAVIARTVSAWDRGERTPGKHWSAIAAEEIERNLGVKRTAAACRQRRLKLVDSDTERSRQRPAGGPSGAQAQIEGPPAASGQIKVMFPAATQRRSVGSPLSASPSLPPESPLSSPISQGDDSTFRPPPYWARPLQHQFEQIKAAASRDATATTAEQLPQSAGSSTRSPTVDHRRRESEGSLFDPREDAIITSYAIRDGPTRWTEVAWRINQDVGIVRPASSCSKRWLEVLSKRFGPTEEQATT
ncbi:unnamed protein product [Parajaminaea phylloscopi]